MANPVARRSRGLLVAGVVTMIVSVILTFIGIGGVVDSSIDAVDAPRIDVPGERAIPLEPGRYAVYAPKPAAGEATIGDVRLGDVVVVAPSGATVPVEAIDTNVVISDGEVKWAAVGQFQAETAGDHTVRIGPPADTTVLVAPTIAEVGERSVLWVLLSGLGFVGFIVGVVVMFTGVARRAGDQGPGPDAPFGRQAPAAAVETGD
jgi:hypothetical protein